LNLAQVVTREIQRRLPGAAVDLEPAGVAEYELTVTYAGFERMRPIDRETAVYAALDRLPPEALARISAIVCVIAG
jgi:acid stress-induced BolA-like protein IbaG/YrbA